MMSDLDNIEFSGKVKGMMTFKEQEHARLLRAMVLPASELAKRMQAEAEQAEAFSRASLDEEFVNRTEHSNSPRCHTPIGKRVGIVTREPFDEQP